MGQKEVPGLCIRLLAEMTCPSVRDVRCDTNWARLPSNGANLGLFRSTLSTFWLINR